MSRLIRLRCADHLQVQGLVRQLQPLFRELSTTVKRQTGPDCCQPSLKQLLFHAVCVVAHLAFGINLLNQSVNVGFKARALRIEFTGELQVVNDFFVEHLARNQQWNSGWVGCDQPYSDVPSSWSISTRSVLRWAMLAYASLGFMAASKSLW